MLSVSDLFCLLCVVCSRTTVSVAQMVSAQYAFPEDFQSKPYLSHLQVFNARKTPPRGARKDRSARDETSRTSHIPVVEASEQGVTRTQGRV